MIPEDLQGERLLVLGAGGWFGRTLRSVVRDEIPLMATGSRIRDGIALWDDSAVSDFRPTLVANFAFLTREREAIDGISQFTSMNRRLTDQFVKALELPSCRSAITISSGAAVTAPQSAYGALKRAEERAALDRVCADRSVVVGRAYSVSGPFVGRPEAYALSDFVLQAARGSVVVRADRPTYRRYVAVLDFLSVCIGLAVRRWSGLVESGGELVEMGELASRVVRRVNPEASIERAALVSGEPVIYASDNREWVTACTRLGLAPMSLDGQIDAVSRFLLDGRR